MSYLSPKEFVPKIVDSGESRIFMATRDLLLRSFMAGAILAIAAAFAITIAVQTGYPIIGAVLFPVGFCMLYLMGYDLLTGVFLTVSLAFIDKRKGVTFARVFRVWCLVFLGNFSGALIVALMTAVVFTYGFSSEPDAIGKIIANIGEKRTIGYKEHGLGGMLTIFIRGILCNWMVSLGVVGAMISTTVSGKVISMWMPIMLFFGMTFEHSVVNMYLFPSALILGGNFSIIDYLVWNEIPTILGNLVGGICLTGVPLYYVHVKNIDDKSEIYEGNYNKLTTVVERK